MQKRLIVKDDRGMTLVEVIIAVFILTATVTVLTTILVASVRYNAKADARQHATLAAESIMESFKAYKVEDLCAQFSSGSFVGCASADSMYYTEPSSKNYKFQINGLVNDNVKYDAKITLSPYTLTRSQSLVAFPEINAYKDGVFRSSTSHDTITAPLQMQDHFATNVRTEIATYLNSGVDVQKDDYTEADIIGTNIKPVKRETVIRLIKNSSTNMTSVTCSMRYHYIVKDYAYYNDASATPEGKVTFPLDYETSGATYSIDVLLDTATPANDIIFYNNPSAVGLERIFIYYYPAYGIEDEIRFETQGSWSNNVECYLLKQVPDVSVMTATELGIAESNYKPKIMGTSIIDLRHNFGMNIGAASGHLDPIMSGFSTTLDYMNSNITKKNYQLMYNVVVEIFHGGEVVSVLEGTKND